MSFRVRLAIVCLSLAFFGGLVAHGVTGTSMALEMATAVSIDSGPETKCPACVGDIDHRIIVCSFDCTAPDFAQAFEPAGLALDAGPMLPVLSPGGPLRGHSVGFDPAPPRTNILI